jgi:hypothetical protein
MREGWRGRRTGRLIAGRAKRRLVLIDVLRLEKASEC